MTSRYAIFDITGITRRLSSLGEFETFEDAWDYIYEHFEDDKFQDLMVDTAERKYWELA
jgi:hypothetical protein